MRGVRDEVVDELVALLTDEDVMTSDARVALFMSPARPRPSGKPPRRAFAAAVAIAVLTASSTASVTAARSSGSATNFPTADSAAPASDSVAVPARLADTIVPGAATTLHIFVSTAVMVREGTMVHT
jgi:hypothetical protein